MAGRRLWFDWVLPVVVVLACVRGIEILAVVVVLTEWSGLRLSALWGVARVHRRGFDCFTLFGRKIILAI